MNIRLQRLITAEGLNNRRFAEKMGIQSSNVSHIINGRNKPGYDFIARLFEVFPNINPYWLILGQGNMYNSLLDSCNVANVCYEVDGTLESEPKSEVRSQERNNTIRNGLGDKIKNEATSQTEIDFNTSKQDAMRSTQGDRLALHSTKSPINNSPPTSSTDSDCIDQVVVFYSDGTFKTYSKR